MGRKKIFGLDISDHSIEAILLEKPIFGKPKVIAYARTLLKGEIVKNGIVRKPGKLSENIIKLLASAQPRPITTPYCILSLPDSQVFTTIFKFPAGLRHEEIRNTIPYKAEEIIPFKSTDVYFDFKTIAVVQSTQEVFYSAVPKKLVDEYIQVLNDAGLVPIAFDLESISLARALMNLTAIRQKDKPRSAFAVLLMDIGARTTNLNIFDRNGIRAGTVVNIAGNRFTKSLAASLKISEKEADQLKIKNGLAAKQGSSKVILILQKELQKIITETKKLISYYQDETGRQVGLIILVGGSSLLPEIDTYLAENLNLKVEIGNPLIKILDPQNLIKLKSKAVLFTNVIGLAIRATGRRPVSGDINLLPLEKKFKIKPEKFDKSSWRLIYIRLAVLSLLTLVFGGLIILKSKNIDPYRRVFSVPEYQTQITPDFDLAVLEEIRANLLLPATTTPTTTDQLVKPEKKVRIKAISSGFLNVREQAGTTYKKIGQAQTGKEYLVIDEKDDWYQIQLDEKTKGWIYSIYTDKIE